MLNLRKERVFILMKTNTKFIIQTIGKNSLETTSLNSDFPEDRCRKHFDIVRKYETGTQLLAAFINYRKRARDILNKHPKNLMIVLKTSVATVRNWLMRKSPEAGKENILEFLNNLEMKVLQLMDLDTLFEIPN